MANKRIIVKEDSETKLNVYVGPHSKHGDEIYDYVQVDPEDYNRLKQYRWMRDEKAGTAYRVLKYEGVPRRVQVARDVMKCEVGDGNVVIFKNKDKLDCRKENLAFGASRDLKTRRPGKWFPRKVENFISFVAKNHPGSKIANFLEEATITTYNQSEIVFKIEEDDNSDQPSAAHHSFQTYLKEFMAEEFEYKGKINVVVKRLPSVVQTPAVTKKPEPVFKEQATTTPAIRSSVAVPLPDSMSFLGKLKTSLGLNPNSNFDFVSFGVQEGEEIHIFQYSKRKAGEAKLQESAPN